MLEPSRNISRLVISSVSSETSITVQIWPSSSNTLSPRTMFPRDVHPVAVGTGVSMASETLYAAPRYGTDNGSLFRASRDFWLQLRYSLSGPPVVFLVSSCSYAPSRSLQAGFPLSLDHTDRPPCSASKKTGGPPRRSRDRPSLPRFVSACRRVIRLSRARVKDVVVQRKCPVKCSGKMSADLVLSG